MLLSSPTELTLPSLGPSLRPSGLNAGGFQPETQSGASAPVSSAASPTGSTSGAQLPPSSQGLFLGSSTVQEQQGQEPVALATPAPASTTAWSSLDGISRPAPTSWQPSPSDGILQSSHPYSAAAQGSAPQRPASTGPTGSNLLTQSLDGGRPLLGSLQQLHGQQAGATAAAAALGAQQQQQRLQVPHMGLAGLTPAQQQLLQQQLLMQQQQNQQKGVGIGGFGQNQNHLANLQAAAQAAQAAQAAAFRQQALLRQTSNGQQQANQNALLQQALLGQNAGNLLQQQATNAALLNAMASQRNGLALQQQQLLAANAEAARNALNAMNMGNGANGRQLNGYNSNPALSAAMLNGHAQMPGNGATLQAMQAQQSLASAQQQLLINQALRANGLQPAAGLGQPMRPPMQLQSEALIAMQRQQVAAQGMRMQQHQAQQAVPTTGGLTTEQLQAMAQLGLLGKGAAPPAAGGLTLAQQQALLSALQSGGHQKLNMGGGMQASLMQQQQRPQYMQPPRPLPPPQLPNSQSLLAAALAQQQQQQNLQPLQYQSQQSQYQHQQPQYQSQPQQFQPPPPQYQPPPQQQGQYQGMRAGGAMGSTMGAPRPAGISGLAGLQGRGGDGSGDPIQTLQDIGRTLSQLGITVEAAVNAGLLGGLSASDVRIVADAHRQEADPSRVPPPPGNAAPTGFAAGSAGLTAPAGTVASVYPSASFYPSADAAAAFAGAPSSPSGSAGGGQRGAASAAAASRPASARASTAGGDDDVDQLLLDVDEERSVAAKKAPLDEAALKARMDEMAAQFDASQYGFFGRRSTSAASGGRAGSDVDGGLAELEPEPAPPGTASERVSRGSAPGWPEGLLPDDLDAKLTLGEAQAHPAQVGVSGTMHLQQMTQAAAHQQAQQAAQMASPWGNTQGDRSDPFGSYLAGMRLGTGF